MKNNRKLSAIILDIEIEIRRSGKYVRPIGESSRWGRKRAYTLLLLVNFQEVVLVLKRIDATFKELADLQPRLVTGKLPDSEEVKRETLIRRNFELVSLLSLDMKTLYMWAALITDILSKSNSTIDLRELDRIALFRHKLITHVHTTPFFRASLTTRSGTKYAPDKEMIEDLYVPWDFRDKRFVGLESLVQKASLFIPELKVEKNRFERIKIMYQRVNEIVDQALKRKVLKFIFRVGVGTDSPGVIAEALYIALRDYRRGL